MKQFFLFLRILVCILLYILGIQSINAATNIWDFNIENEYTLSNSTSLSISGSLVELKRNTFSHEGVHFNATLMNGSYDSVVENEYAYVTNYARDSVSIIDVTIPSSPNYITQIRNNNTTIRLDGAAGIVKDGNFLYVASVNSDALQIIDISNPSSPIAAGNVLNSTTTRLNGARGITKSGNYVYIVSTNDDSLTIIDVSNPYAPFYVGKYYVSNGVLNGARDIKVQGNYAYIANYNRDSLAIIDISNPNTPIFISELRQTTRLNGAYHVEISGNYAYVSAYLNSSVMIIDISNPNIPLEVTNISGGSYSLTNPRDLIVDDNVLFITSYGNDAVNAVDISNPSSPVYITKIINNGATPRIDGANGIFKVGNYLYIAGYISDSLNILEWKYDSSSPSITPNIPYNYGTNNIGNISSINGPLNQGLVSYQISKDAGNTWYYWNSTNWVSTIGGVEDSNSLDIINTNIVDFNNISGGTGNFLFKAFLNSNGDQKVELDTIEVTTISLPSLSVTYTDNSTSNTIGSNDVVIYNIGIENSGTQNATGINAEIFIDSDYNNPYGFTYQNCGSPTPTFSSPTLNITDISISTGNTCNILYYVQVNSGAPSGSTIPSSIDVSSAIEGGNNPDPVNADTLTVFSCTTNSVDIVFETDNFGEDIFWSLVPSGNSCGVGEIANGGNTNLSCSDGGSPASANPNDPYSDNTSITEGSFNLLVGNQYDLHYIDDYGDGNTAADPDVLIVQNGITTDAINISGNGGVFSFTVQQPTACIDTINPEVTINQATSQPDPTTVNNIEYIVIFNEPINLSTFSISDINISGTTGVITAGPTEISPFNGTSFQFSVSGMSPGDIVTANIPAGGIQDNSGNPNNNSSSLDNQVTYNGAPPSVPILNVIYTDNDSDNTAQTSQIIQYNINISNAGIPATGISAIIPVNSNLGSPYSFIYENCGTATHNFASSVLNITDISISTGSTCNILYYVQVNSGAPSGSTIPSSIDVSSAIEGGNNPDPVNADTLTVFSCTTNSVDIIFGTDNWGYETFWSLVPSGNSCGVGEIANGGNTNQMNCNSGGNRIATNGNGYGNNTSITENITSLNVGNQYNLYVVDDYGDGITISPDISIVQNNTTTNTFEVSGNGGVFSFTVQQPTACIDTINPEVTINQATSQPDPTTVNNIEYIVIFNEPINLSTFSISDINISGTTGVITAGPTEISPFNGTSFQFSVSGMSPGDIVTANIPAGGIQDNSGNPNNNSSSLDNQVTYSIDTTAPNITNTNFVSGELLPGGTHDIIITYNDSDTGINSSSANIILNKWDGISSWGGNISGTGISAINITGSSAQYSTNSLSYGKYRYNFSIEDIAGNSANTGNIEFYIDEPEFEIGSGSVNIGDINDSTIVFSGDINITARTVGAGFDITMENATNLVYDIYGISPWDGNEGLGYDISPFSGIILPSTSGTIIGSQGENINTNGDKNIYIYTIRFGVKSSPNQPAGEYEGTIDFDINFSY